MSSPHLICDKVWDIAAEIVKPRIEGRQAVLGVYPDSSIPTVSIETDNNELMVFYNEQYVDSLDSEDLRVLLEYEMQTVNFGRLSISCNCGAKYTSFPDHHSDWCDTEL